jgi:predicted HicB family RNase H-like nuclease
MMNTASAASEPIKKPHGNCGHKRGFKDNPKNKSLVIRVYGETHKKWLDQANIEGLTLSAWVTEKLNN